MFKKILQVFIHFASKQTEETESVETWRLKKNVDITKNLSQTYYLYLTLVYYSKNYLYALKLLNIHYIVYDKNNNFFYVKNILLIYLEFKPLFIL